MSLKLKTACLTVATAACLILSVALPSQAADDGNNDGNKLENKGEDTREDEGGKSPTKVPTPALLPGLIGMGVVALRKRNAKAPEALSEV